MSRNLQLVLGCLVAAGLLVGCSSDTPTDPQAGSDWLKAVIAGEIEAGATAFEVSAPAPGEPSPGSFLIRGSDLRYEADPGLLVADIVLVNDSSSDFPGPARLVFLQLLPQGVTVFNPDNADSALAAGALFEFAFAGDDTLWRAGATTEPRTVQFQVAAGTSIGFVARILVGDEPTGGAIGGLVWHDRDRDGLRDEGEAGVGDVDLFLRAGGEPDAGAVLLTTRTDPDGAYRFAPLAAGHYAVLLAPEDGLVPTTAPAMEVLLVEYEGQVMDFLQADFGVAPADTDTCLVVGACVVAKGGYLPEPDRVAAEILNLCGRPDDCEGEDVGDDDGQEGEGMCWGRLSGPITGLDAERNAVAVMGTWVELPAADWAKHGLDGDLELGRRVRVNVELVTDPDGDRVVACRLHRWDGSGDRVRGLVQEVVRDEAGAVVGVRVLDTLVTVPDRFGCDDRDHYDDPDDPDDQDDEDDEGDQEDGDS